MLPALTFNAAWTALRLRHASAAAAKPSKPSVPQSSWPGLPMVQPPPPLLLPDKGLAPDALVPPPLVLSVVVLFAAVLVVAVI